jgi:hypothetical protein
MMKSAGVDEKNFYQMKDTLHFIALPRLSISPSEYRSASAARDAFERATST